MKVGPTKYAPSGWVSLKTYADGGYAMQVYAEGGVFEPLYKATVNIPDNPPADQCVWIKDWSENEGVLDAFVKAGIGTLTGRTCLCGYAVAHELKFNDKLLS